MLLEVQKNIEGLAYDFYPTTMVVLLMQLIKSRECSWRLRSHLLTSPAHSGCVTKDSAALQPANVAMGPLHIAKRNAEDLCAVHPCLQADGISCVAGISLPIANHDFHRTQGSEENKPTYALVGSSELYSHLHMCICTYAYKPTLRHIYSL